MNEDDWEAFLHALGVVTGGLSRPDYRSRLREDNRGDWLRLLRRSLERAIDDRPNDDKGQKP